MSDSIRPKEAWDAFARVFDQIQRIGMVHPDTDVDLKKIEDFIRQEMAK
jgi:hypothetical protein